MKLTDQMDAHNSVASSMEALFESSFIIPHDGNKKSIILVGKVIRVEIAEEMLDVRRKRAAQFLVFVR